MGEGTEQTNRRRLVVRNSVYEVGAQFGRQGLSLVSNLVLTRLLFPEAFGLMQVVSIVLFGLTMLSDVGIVQAVIQNPRGDEKRFLDTAWTMQILRGGILCGLTWALAWPVSLFYGEPMLLDLLLVAGVQLVIAGFESTSFFTLRRQVQSLRLASVELSVQLAQLVATVATAFVWRSVWALLIGAVFGGLVRLVWSHLIPVGYRNSFAWDPEARREITRFGRWIYGSSIASFIYTQFARVVLGRLLGMATLGVYGVAALVTEAISGAVSRITGGVFYPIFSRVSESEPEQLRSEYYFARLRVDAVALTVLGGLSVLGDVVVDLLWDPRYADAGWMLRILCLRVAVACVMLPCEVCLVATGESRFGFARSVVTMIAIVIGVPIGYQLAGTEGLVWAVAISEIPTIFVLWPAAARRGLLSLPRELLAVCFFAGGALLGLAVRFMAVTLEWI